MSFQVYLLKCSDGSYYAGHTDALETRLAQHRAGLGCDWTKRRLPVELMWADCAPTRDEALAFERRIKGWTRAKKEALIAGNWPLVSRLARSNSVSREPVEGHGETVVPAPFDKLRTNDSGAGKFAEADRNFVRPEPVEGRRSHSERPSTSLRTNGVSSGKLEK